ncbi:MAG: hypothetical protein WKF54_13200 [Nocardioidaceae bacterium]
MTVPGPGKSDPMAAPASAPAVDWTGSLTAAMSGAHEPVQLVTAGR